jgi:hypothetical protein
MTMLPALDLRRNAGTWAVPSHALPAVANRMRALLAPETFDLGFTGQFLETTYFDTPHFALRKARRRGDSYLTLRIRCYQAPGQPEAYALSAKTDDQKFRTPLDSATADDLLQGANLASVLARYLPGDLLARLADLVGDEPLGPVMTVCARRYAVEDDTDRCTLDASVATDTGRELPYGVLEFKSRLPGAQPPPSLAALALRPIKLSKFLWATRV